jgi:hypothetical protein
VIRNPQHNMGGRLQTATLSERHTSTIWWTCVWIVLATLGAGSHAADEPAIRLVGRDGETVSLSAAEVAAMSHIEVTGKEKGGTTATYSGINVASLLAKVGVPAGEDLRGQWLRCHVVVSASDGYQVAFGIAEFEDSFTDHRIILADRRNGEALDAKHGPLQIVVPHEKRQSRWVRMVTEIRIVDAQEAATPNTN